LMNNKEYTNTAVEVLSCQNCIGGFWQCSYRFTAVTEINKWQKIESLPSPKPTGSYLINSTPI
jgi:hypothetical protein